MVLYGGVDITTSAGGAGEVTDYTPFSLQEYETEWLMQYGIKILHIFQRFFQATMDITILSVSAVMDRSFSLTGRTST